MEFRQLQYALMVARERHFSRAALKLRIAQPSLSQQIAKLEKELGLPLFDRTKSQIELTHAGQRFIEKAEHIVDMMEQLKIEMEDVSQLKTGRLVVGSLPMTGSHVMPVLLPAFRARYPQIEVVLVEDTTANLEKLATSGETDLSLLSLPLESEQLDFEPLLEESIVLAAPPGFRPQSAKKAEPLERHTIRLEHVAEQPFIVLKKGQGFRQITLDLCRQAGFTPQIVFESNNIETIQSLVAAGMGVALVPQMVMREANSRHAPVYFALEHPFAARTLVIGWRKNRYLSQAALSFIETVKDVMRTRPQF
jgi:LysR family hydrogen peroxide-inducible transcriptional activator